MGWMWLWFKALIRVMFLVVRLKHESALWQWPFCVRLHYQNPYWNSSSYRRLLLDDSRGVAEALNETDCVLDECKGLTVSVQNHLGFHECNLIISNFLHTKFIFMVQDPHLFQSWFFLVLFKQIVVATFMNKLVLSLLMKPNETLMNFST